jgi:hypothetical protein
MHLFKEREKLTMIERLIENWLTNLSERKDLDIPFRLLLATEGHRVNGYRTIHGPMELGKDIVSWYPHEKRYYFFQLKSGDATQNDWVEMERQLLLMIEVPYIHPNYQPGDPYQPVWVCTGQLHETVRIALGLKNDEARRHGKPGIEVWDRSMLVKKFQDTFFNLLFVDDPFAVDFLKRWSQASEYLADEEELRLFFHNYLFALAGITQPREMRLHLATYTLMLTQLSQRYEALGGLYSAIDCTILGTIQLYEFITTQQTKKSIAQSSMQLTQELIGFFLQKLVDACSADPDTLENLIDPEGGMSEIWQLPFRVHSLVAKLGLSLLLKALRKQSYEAEQQFIYTIIECHPTFCHLVSECQMGTWWLAILALLQSGREMLATNCVKQTFAWFLGFHEKSQFGLPDPYQPYQFAMNHHMRTETDTRKLQNMNRHSYMLPLMLKLICHLGLRDDLAAYWKLISQMQVHEYIPSTVAELLAYRPRSGQMTVNGFPVTGSWAALQQLYTERLTGEIAEYVERYPEILLLLALAYPWRAQWREMERYIIPSTAQLETSVDIRR